MHIKKVSKRRPNNNAMTVKTIKFDNGTKPKRT